MGAIKRNGVDGAIEVLCRLAQGDGSIPTARLVRETALPRASLHRLTSILDRHGIVEKTRGTVSVGPAARAIVAARGAKFEREHARQHPKLDSPRACPPPEALAPVRPLDLCAPATNRPRTRFRIGFSNASLGNPWRTALVHSIEHGAARLGAEVERLSVRHAADDPVRQAHDIDRLRADGIDGLLVSTDGAAPVTRAIERAIAAGITTVFVDRGLTQDVGQASFVTSSDRIIGRTTALWLCEILDGRGRLLLLPGQPGTEPARVRLDSARKVFADWPGIEIAHVHWTDWNAARARALTAECLAAGPLDGVWCDSGQHGIGSLHAFLEAGYASGQIPPHTGGDMNGAYKTAIRHKVPLGAVDYPPFMGQAAVRVLHAAMTGHWVPSRLDVRSDIILTRGHATASIKPTMWAEEHVRWDLPDDVILRAGIGEAYTPHSFRINYPGNSYNRSTAQLAKTVDPRPAAPATE